MVELRQQFPCVYEPGGAFGLGLIRNSPIGDAHVTLLYGLDGVDGLHPLENGGHGGIDLGGFTDPALNTSPELQVDHKPIRPQIGGWVWAKAQDAPDSVMGWYTMLCHEPDGVPKPGSLFSLYLHSPGPSDAPLGAWVEAGEAINVVNNTGLSTGPHLHWGAYAYGEDGQNHLINPLSAFSGSVTSAAAEVIAVQVPAPDAPFAPAFPLEDTVQVVRNLDIATGQLALNIAERDITQGQGTAQVQLLSDGDLSTVTIAVKIPIAEFMAEVPGFQR